MSQRPDDEPRAPSAATQQGAVAVISAYGAFRVLLVVLAAWSFFAGFALLTGFDQMSLGGERTAERVAGLQMLVFVPVYALLVWDRERYRLLIWVPYVAQLAIIVPTAWALFSGDPDSVLLLIVSIAFFVLLFYFWWNSHPLDFFFDDEDEEPLDDDDDDEDALDDEEPGSGPHATPGASLPAPGPGPRADDGDPTRPRGPRRRSGRFRRRDG